jgi:succinate dehydrogenase / fumarate reductase membrane anchor subunit
MRTSGDSGAHKSTVAHWWHQRLTAVALIALGLWLAIALTRIDLGSQVALVAWIGEPLNATLLGLLSIAATYHSSLGVQVVLEDYVPDAGQLRLSLLLSRVAHGAVLATCLFAILGAALGAA